MKNELEEDFKDIHDIKKQKKEQKDSKEEMPDWKFGKGIKDNEVKKRGV